LLDGKIEDITLETLRQLIEDKVPEGKALDYKRDRIGYKDSEKKEFLQDVSSFANTNGGHMIIGMDEGDEEERGFPTSIVGFEVKSIDEEKGRLENIIRDGLEPRLNGVTIRPLPLNSSSSDLIAVIIRIPKSFNLPHMVKYQGHHTFYSRNSSGKYPLDVSELRNLFGLHDSLAQQIKNFRVERLSRIISGDTPIPLYDYPCVALYIIPFSSFSGDIRLNLSSYNDYDLYTIGNARHYGKYTHTQRSQSGRYNFEGYVTYSGYSHNTKQYEEPEYTQLFRNGIIEAVWTYPFHSFKDKKPIPSLLFEEKLIESVQYYLSRLETFGVPYPIYVMLNLVRVSNQTMVLDNFAGKSMTFDRDTLAIPESIATHAGINVPKLMKEAFDIVWNSVGEPASIYYDDKGDRTESDKNPFFTY
jgi:hypothetical protein